jgi:hypothetical protein
VPGVTTRSLGVALARQTRRDAKGRAVERRVVARREFRTHADTADVLGQAHTEQVDVVGIDQVVSRGAGAAWVISVCGSLSAKRR